MVEQQAVIKTVIGKVISDKMDKTIVVEVIRKVKHPLYGKYVKSYSRMNAHDVDNKCKVGDVVEIKQSRPVSKTKNWVLVQVIESTEK